MSIIAPARRAPAILRHSGSAPYPITAAEPSSVPAGSRRGEQNHSAVSQSATSKNPGITQAWRTAGQRIGAAGRLQGVDGQGWHGIRGDLVADEATVEIALPVPTEMAMYCLPLTE